MHENGNRLIAQIACDGMIYEYSLSYIINEKLYASYTMYVFNNF